MKFEKASFINLIFLIFDYPQYNIEVGTFSTILELFLIENHYLMQLRTNQEQFQIVPI